VADTPYAVACTLGWSNSGPTPLQLYALDAGPGPRWANPPHGRTAEDAIDEHTAAYEGDNAVVVLVGRVDSDVLERARVAAAAAVHEVLRTDRPHQEGTAR
jgi:hypothetical protein